MKPKIAVLYFPGNNCEHETVLACKKAGMDTDLLRWNTKEDISKYNGFIIPGGFTYEDRIRAGVISSKQPIMQRIKEEAAKGKVVLGICNGAQVLVEAGLIPGLKNDVEFALAPNKNPFVSGYYCSWVKVKMSTKKKNAFNLNFSENEIFDIPIAHGEGRFTTLDKDAHDGIIKNDQAVFKYCDEKGDVSSKFPSNPNGALLNIAGLCNKEGNVMALMPHPERAFFNKQLPGFRGEFRQSEAFAAGSKIFLSIKEYIEAGNL